MKNILFCLCSSANKPQYLDDVIIHLQTTKSQFEKPKMDYVYSNLHHMQAVAFYEDEYTEKDLLDAFDDHIKNTKFVI
jgi:hypothetical protein